MGMNRHQLHKLVVSEVGRLDAEWGVDPGRIHSKINGRLRAVYGHCKLFIGSAEVNIALLMQDMPEEAILDTVRHEYAHALAWFYDKERGHGKAWKEWAEALGALPSASNTVEDKVANYRRVEGQ